MRGVSKQVNCCPSKAGPSYKARLVKKRWAAADVIASFNTYGVAVDNTAADNVGDNDVVNRYKNSSSWCRVELLVLPLYVDTNGATWW